MNLRNTQYNRGNGRKAEKMFEEALVRHCSPTLAGLKTGSMFVFRCDDPDRIAFLTEEYNVRLSERGVRMIILRKRDHSALVYVYRPDMLKADLCDRMSSEILMEEGYDCFDPEFCLHRLRTRLSEGDRFPHEVGLFLGYPPEDVRGFIQHQGACCKCSGCWKVYGDVEKSKKCFERFRKCRRIYYHQWAMGKTVESLTVPA